MIAALRHRVDIQHNVKTTTKGVKSDTWRSLETVYARVEPLRSSERRVAGQNAEIVTHSVVVRYRNNFGGVLELVGGGILEFISGDPFEFSGTFTKMLPRYRLVFGTRTFDIRSALHKNPRKRFTTLMCSEIVH